MSGPRPAWSMALVSIFLLPSNTVSPNTPYSSGGVNQMPQRPLGSVPLELSQEPVDDSSSSKMDW